MRYIQTGHIMHHLSTYWSYITSTWSLNDLSGRSYLKSDLGRLWLEQIMVWIFLANNYWVFILFQFLSKWMPNNSGYGNFVLQYWQTEIEMSKCWWLVLVDSLKHSGYLPDTSQLCLMKYSIIQVVPNLNPEVLHILLYIFKNCMSHIFNELYFQSGTW